MILNPVEHPDSKIYQKTSSSIHARHDRTSEKLAAGMPEHLSDFLAGLGLAVGSGLLVIPQKNHYFYDFEEMKRVKTLVNLKRLNHVRELRGFMHSLSELLHDKTNFVGCFVDDKTQNRFSGKHGNISGRLPEMPDSYEIGIESRIPFINRIYSFIDAKTNRYLTRKTVTNLLKEFGFQVVIMEELNGVTYFYSRKVST